MTGERLDWLLRALGMTGKQLAQLIEVDAATLSKWRKNKRRLDYASAYAERIVEWALTCPREQETGVVHRMLTEELSCTESSAYAKALRLWLTTPDHTEPHPMPIQTTEVFEVPLKTTLGLENMFQMQNELFALLETLPDGQQIVMADFGAVSWNNAAYFTLAESVRINRTALEGTQHQMTILDQLTDIYRPRDVMFQWMPVYLQPNVRTCFYRSVKPFPLRQNFLLIRGHAALTVSSTSAEPDRLITSLYRDPEYVRLFDTMTDILLADSRPMMQLMQTRELLPFLRMIGENMRSNRLLYMINSLPTFRNMPEELLKEILTDNHITGELYEQCLAAGTQSTATRTRCESRQIYDLDAIEAALEQEYLVDYDLSALVGREVRVTRQQFRVQLAYLREHLRAPHYALSMYPFSRLDISVLPPCNLIVQDDGMAAAWDAGKYTCRMYSEELSVVNGFYQYADSVWERISPICRAAEWCRRRIDELLTQSAR